MARAPADGAAVRTYDADELAAAASVLGIARGSDDAEGAVPVETEVTSIAVDAATLASEVASANDRGHEPGADPEDPGFQPTPAAGVLLRLRPRHSAHKPLAI